MYLFFFYLFQYTFYTFSQKLIKEINIVNIYANETHNNLIIIYNILLITTIFKIGDFSAPWKETLAPF